MFQDAGSLHNDGRLGTPDHLCGLACECALKAILCGLGMITKIPPQKPYKVHIDKLWDEYVAALHGRPGTVPSLDRNNAFSAWKSDDRYLDDCAFSATRVAGHMEGAIQGMTALELATVQGIVA